MNPTASPLSWPLGWKRTPAGQRVRSPFTTTRHGGRRPVSVSDASNDVEDELLRMGVDCAAIIVSTNLALRLDGFPRSGQGEPSDPGVAVYWLHKGENHVLACDRYDRVGCNLRAIAKHIEALRGIARWGCGDLEQAFRGYAALPDQAGGQPWWEVLELAGPTTDVVTIRDSYKRLAMKCHPDQGGTLDDWHALQGATKQGLEHAKAGA